MSSLSINGHEVLAIESGSNSNGYWVKLSSGVMIQWSNFTLDFGSSEPMKSGSITLPVAFVGSSVVSINGGSTGNINYVYRCAASTTDDATSFSYNIANWDNQGRAVNGRYFSWIALGKWK